MKVVEQIDVGIEAYVDTVETRRAHVLHRLDISHGEVIHTNIITTLHVDAVVVGQCCAIDVVAPVGVVMIGIVIIAVLGIVQEVELQGIRRGTYAALHLGDGA